jgi:hypothetical protein
MAMDNSPSQFDQTARAELVDLRSQVLDAFSELEQAIAQLLKAAGQKPNGSHLGAKVEKFREIDGIPQMAKANHSKRDRLADQICDLFPVRADIVHSQMRVCRVDGVATANFINSQNASQSYPEGRLLTVEALTQIVSDARKIVSDIAQLGRVTQPSSPPPPSPGEAGVP